MREVTSHSVDRRRIAEALEGIDDRAFRHWHRCRWDDLTLKRLQTMCDELVDHVAARLPEDPALRTEPAQIALRTAAECALGVLTIGTFPSGDFDVFFPLIDEMLSSEDFHITYMDQEPTTANWLETFALCLLSGLIWEHERVIGLQLRDDFAPELRNATTPTSRPDPASLAEMDALCGYLATLPEGRPGGRPKVPLCKPGAGERAEAALRLDALDALTPDQRLLRVLLDDDQGSFEQALADRLAQYRESVDAETAPVRSLLPVGTIALAALAVQVHGWELEVRSDYLPEALLRNRAG